MHNIERKRNNKKLIIGVAIGLVALATIIAIVIGMAHKNRGGNNDHTPQGLPAPSNMRVQGNTILWDSVSNANGYRVYLGEHNDFFSYTTSNKLIVSDLDSGHVYKFRVAAVNDKGVSSEHLSNAVDINFNENSNNGNILVGLDMPQPDINGAKTYLEWERIPNAIAYSVSVNGQEQVQTVTPEFKVSDLFTGLHQLRVRALGDGVNYANSQWSSPITFSQVGQDMIPPYVQLTTNAVSWNPVAGASSYEVSINGSITQKTQCTLPYSELNTGTNSIQVRAINSSSHSAWSNTVTHIVSGSGEVTLFAPSIFFNGASIEWSSMSGATSYDVSVDGIETNQTQVGFNFSQLGTKPGVKKVVVRSRNGNAISDWSNLVQPTVNLSTPNASVNGTTLSWNGIEGANSGYQVCIDGAMQPKQTATTYNLSGLNDGTHMVNVRAATNTPLELASAFSDTVGITVGGTSGAVTAPYIGLVEEGNVGANIWIRERAIRWNAVAGALGYDISIDDSVVKSNSPYLMYHVEGLSKGTHRIKVRANNSSSTSSWSNEITFDPSKEMDSTTVNGDTTSNNLPKPTLGFGGRTCSWNGVSGAVAYELVVNGTSYITTGQSYNLAADLGHGAYQIRVRALNNTDKLSQWSNTLNLIL